LLFGYVKSPCDLKSAKSPRVREHLVMNMFTIETSSDCLWNRHGIPPVDADLQGEVCWWASKTVYEAERKGEGLS
jgi:hypothetical protein